MPGSGGPKPWRQSQLRTTFLRVPADDWPAVKIGAKTEFRTSGYHSSTLIGVKCPIPVVGYRVTNERTDHDSLLLVLEQVWIEPLASLSDESLAREGFPDFAHFRRYWMGRTKRRFRPLDKVQAHRVRIFTQEDRGPMGDALLRHLYGEHL